MSEHDGFVMQYITSHDYCNLIQTCKLVNKAIGGPVYVYVGDSFNYY